LVLVGATVLLVLHTRLQPVDAAGDPGLLVPFTVERGSGLAPVAYRLEKAGLVRDWRAFALLARWRDQATRLRAGEYELSPAWPAERVLEQLTVGRARSYPVVIPEGLRAVEIARRLADAGLTDADAFLATIHDPDFVRELGIDADDLEGYLYPETYRMPRGLPARDIARVMVAQFERIWREEIEPLRAAHAVREPDAPVLDRHQLVTLASIVEKETGAAAERPLIASVFWNRLRRGMRLETDPTVIYGIPDFDGNLTRKHLLDASNRYNTYKIPGLPPGPIANPGVAALRAVADPPDSDYLYFVARGDGTHVFSRSYAAHERAVDEFQRRRRRR